MIRRNKSIIGGLIIGERNWISFDQSGTHEIIENSSTVILSFILTSTITMTQTLISTLTQTEVQESEIF